jgi:CheY-like chemotaxis protein
MRLIRRTSDRAQQAETGAPRRILVADDDPSIATLIQVTLKDPRYEIVAVKNGLAGRIDLAARRGL